MTRWGCTLLGAAILTAGAVAEVKPVDWVGPELCGQPNRNEQVCLNQSARTGRYYLSTSSNGKPGVYVPIALEPTGLERPIVGAVNKTFRGIGVVNINGYAVEATLELSLTTPVVPNAVTTAKLLTNGKPLSVGHGSFRMEPVAVTQ